jgi:hypothetical protein
MAADFGIEFSGLKEALKELNDIDKKLRRQITRLQTDCAASFRQSRVSTA